MYVSVSPAMQRLAREANEILTQENGRGFDMLPMPEFEDLYGPGGDEQLVPMGHVDANNTLIMLHSSGMLVLCCLRRDQDHLYAVYRFYCISKAHQSRRPAFQVSMGLCLW